MLTLSVAMFILAISTVNINGSVDLKIISLTGKVTTGKHCDIPVVHRSYELEYDCHKPKKNNKVHSSSVTTNMDGSFNSNVSLEWSTKTQCVFALCYSKLLSRVCSKLMMNPIVVKNGRKQIDSRATLEFCVSKTKRAERDELVRIKRAWNDQDMSWLKRFSFGSQPDGAGASQYEQVNRGWSGQKYPLSHFQLEKRLWEGAEDEVGWMKRSKSGKTRGDTERLHPDRFCYYARLLGKNCEELRKTRNLQDDFDDLPQRKKTEHNVSDSQLSFPDDNKRKWKESDISWL